MSDKLTLDVVQAAEIKYGAERNGATNADLKALSSGDMFALILPILRGYGRVVVDILQKIGETNFPGAKKFVAKENFKLKKDGGICSYLGSNFTAWFMGKVEDDVAPSTLTYAKLTKNSKDDAIVASLGGEDKAKTSLVEIFHRISLQPNGETGSLLTSGWANIFYVEDVNGVLRAVDVYWRDDGWRVVANPVDGPDGWGADRLVFSRNPLGTQAV